MIIYHQNNVAKLKGNHVFYMLRPHGYASFVVSKTSAAAANNEIEQARSGFRFVFSRVHGRVN